MIGNNSLSIDHGLFALETFALQIKEVDCETFQGQTFLVDLGTIENIANISGGVATNLSNTSIIYSLD